MKVLVACEMSGRVRDAFRAMGHDAWSCDILPDMNGSEYHLQCDVLTVLGYGWDLIIAFTPCDFFTRSGTRWLFDAGESKNGKLFGIPRWKAMFEAAELFNAIFHSACPKVAMENPRPHKYAKALIGPSTQTIQPWMFGHGEVKETHLWLKNLPPLNPTHIVEGREAKIHKMPPSKDRAMLRSLTYPGIARAMAEQWGK